MILVWRNFAMADVLSFLRWFNRAPPREAEDPALADRRRVALLMAAMASVDGRLAPAERALLARVVAGEGRDAEALIDEAIAAAGNAAMLEETLAHIRNDWPTDRRAALFRQAELMAAADGALHEFEDGMLERLGRLLGLEARQR
jgi:uncharacterized tellurite resistance protein B-like protein